MVPIRRFFPNSPVKSTRLSIFGIGILEHRRPSITYRPTGTGDYLFMYLYESGWFQTERGVARHPAGTMVLWRPGERQYYGCEDSRWRHSFLHCDGSWVEACVASADLQFNTAIRVLDPAVIERGLLNIHQEVIGYPNPDERIVCNLFENWLRDIRRASLTDEQTSTTPPKLQALKTHLDAHFNQDQSLDALARRIHLSVPRLCSLFKRHYSCSVTKYIIGLRMKHAAYLLKDRNLLIAEVAGQVGYEDQFHFSKLFKSRYGLSPRQFQKVNETEEKPRG